MTSLKQNQMELLLPKGYLSWSALHLFETSEKKYIEKYFYGEDDNRSNDFMSFGKRYAEAKETGDCKGDPMLEFAMNAVPSYQFPEYKLEAELSTPYGKIKLLAIPDSFSEIDIQILEYKTGKIPWTQSKVQKHGQLHFYAVSTKAKFSVNPSQQLWWIETTDKDENGNKIPVRPTGITQVFKFKASDQELKEMEQRIIRACLRIDKLYRQHLSLQK